MKGFGYKPVCSSSASSKIAIFDEALLRSFFGKVFYNLLINIAVAPVKNICKYI